MDSNIILDVNQGTWDFFLKRHPFIFFFLVVLPVFVSIGIGYFEFVVASSTVFQNQSTEQGAFFILIAPLIVTFLTIVLVRSRIEKLFIPSSQQRLAALIKQALKRLLMHNSHI